MRLNMDCIRDILLCVEENTGLRQYCIFVDIDFAEQLKDILEVTPNPKEYQRKLLTDYKNNELIYHIDYCIEADLIAALDISESYEIVITDLTPTGHELLGRIRDNTIWGKVKETLSKCNINTIAELLPIAKTIGGEAINATLASLGFPPI